MPAAHGFSWLRDLRALGTDAARLRARALVADWIGDRAANRSAQRPDVVGARFAAWLGHYDFFAASADDAFRQQLMARLLSDARRLAAALPAEELDARALTALKGLIAAAVAMPEHAAFLTRALRFLPQEIGRQVLPDGCHAERSPAAHLAALQDLTEIRALLQAAPGAATGRAVRRDRTDGARPARAAPWRWRARRCSTAHKEENPALIDLVLTQAGRSGRAPASLVDGGFQRLQAGRSRSAGRLRRAAAAPDRPPRARRHAVDGAVGRPRPDDRQLRRRSRRRRRNGGTRRAPPPRIRPW